MSPLKPAYRHEFKYVVTAAQIAILKNRIAGLMHPDPHVGADGIYNIRSLYFDDYQNRFYYENENGTDPRVKYRIRIYNHSSERITLECKRKEHAKTLKTSCPLTLEQTRMLMEGKAFNAQPTDHPLIHKVLEEMRTHMLRPVVIVEYDRIPYIYKNGNVRVTFDTNISSSSDVQGFLNDVIPKRPIMPVGQHVLEVKFDEYLPDFIYRNLNLGKLLQSTYSKYYLCRKFSLRK